MHEAVEGYEDDEDEHDPLRCTNQLKPKVDCSDTQDLRRVANKPVQPVEDRPSLACGATPAQRHEGLDEAEGCGHYSQYSMWIDSWIQFCPPIEIVNNEDNTSHCQGPGEAHEEPMEMEPLIDATSTVL